MAICSVFFSLSFLTACGVFRVDAVKSVSGKEGESVTLHTDVVKQRDDKIAWSYGPNNTFVARMNGKASSNMLSDDQRFIGRVKMNDQTGDLTITNITSEHNGLYTLKISINKKNSNKRFNLTVNQNIINSINKPAQQDQDLTIDASPESSDSRRMRVTIIAVVVPLLICVFIIIIIFVFKHRRMCHKESVLETIYSPVTDKGSSSSSSSSEDSNSSWFPDEPEKKHIMN